MTRPFVRLAAVVPAPPWCIAASMRRSANSQSCGWVQAARSIKGRTYNRVNDVDELGRDVRVVGDFRQARRPALAEDDADVRRLDSGDDGFGERDGVGDGDRAEACYVRVASTRACRPM